jgi:hypothetical protein
VEQYQRKPMGNNSYRTLSMPLDASGQAQQKHETANEILDEIAKGFPSSIAENERKPYKSNRKTVAKDEVQEEPPDVMQLRRRCGQMQMLCGVLACGATLQPIKTHGCSPVPLKLPPIFFFPKFGRICCGT